MISGPTSGEAVQENIGQARCRGRYLKPDGQQPRDHVLSKKNSGPSLKRPIAAVEAVEVPARKRTLARLGMQAHLRHKRTCICRAAGGGATPVVFSASIGVAKLASWPALRV